MTVIFLNGCSSAGKTSLARSLQDQLGTPYLYTGIDDALRMVPARYHDHPQGLRFVDDQRGGVTLAIGPVGAATIRAHQVATTAIARAGVGLILDEVVVSPTIRDRWHRMLYGIDVFYVGVRCDLAELERREKERGDRVFGQARGQFDSVHLGMSYDLEVDTTNTRAEDLASFVLSARPSW